MPNMLTWVYAADPEKLFAPGNIRIVFEGDPADDEWTCDRPRCVYANDSRWIPGGNPRFTLIEANAAALERKPVSCICMKAGAMPVIVDESCSTCVDNKYAKVWRVTAKIEIDNPLWLPGNNQCNINWESDDVCRNPGASLTEGVRWLIHRGAGFVNLKLGAEEETWLMPKFGHSGYFFVPAEWDNAETIVPCWPGGHLTLCVGSPVLDDTRLTSVQVGALFYPCSGVIELCVWAEYITSHPGPPPSAPSENRYLVARWIYAPEESPRDCTKTTRVRLRNEDGTGWATTNSRTIGTISTHAPSGIYKMGFDEETETDICVDCATAPKRDDYYNVPCKLKAPYYLDLIPLT